MGTADALHAALAEKSAVTMPGSPLSAATAKTPLFQPWIDGTSPAEPLMQVQGYDADTYVIRQSIRTNFEGPFLYLLFGHDRALLIDTGAGGLEIRPTIDRLIADWLAAHDRQSIPLVVAHSHSHGDHRVGDPEFEDRPDTTIVGWSASEVAAFYGITHWPEEVVQCDLGARILDVIPTPGHHPAHIMLFDRNTGLLISGDCLYRGRLYVPIDQLATFRDSIDRVAAFTRDRKVSHILGSHIEMTLTPGRDYTDAAPSHPLEQVLELPPSALTELQTALHAMRDTLRHEVHDDFIIVPLPPLTPLLPKASTP